MRNAGYPLTSSLPAQRLHRPPLTYSAIIIGSFFTGTVVVETVFSWPGVGQLVVGAVTSRDFQVLQAVVIIGASIYVASNLLVDIIYTYLAPRIRYT
jgi:peptide/nickel transport system permease protein